MAWLALASTASPGRADTARREYCNTSAAVLGNAQLAIRRFLAASAMTARCRGRRRSAGTRPHRRPTPRWRGGRSRWRRPVPARRPAGRSCARWAGLSAPRGAAFMLSGAGIVAIRHSGDAALLHDMLAHAGGLVAGKRGGAPGAGPAPGGWRRRRRPRRRTRYAGPRWGCDTAKLP